MKKKTTLVLGITFLFISNAFTQNETTIENNNTNDVLVKIGIKAGYSLGKLASTTDNIYSENYESVSGIDWGITFEFPLTQIISVQPEINFTHRGGIRSGLQPIISEELSMQLNKFAPFYGLPVITNNNPLFATYESETDLNYLEVPVLVKFGLGDDLRIYTELGPYVGILLKATQHTDGISSFYYNSEGNNVVMLPGLDGLPPLNELPEQDLAADTNIKDNLHTVNFGGIVGLGLIKKLGNKSEVYVDARASYSFNAIQINKKKKKSNIGGVIFSLGYVYSVF